MSRNNNTPKRKRLDQRARLRAAEKFIRNYSGKNLIKGYAKWFGVNKLLAIKELELAGVAIPEERKKHIAAASKLRAQQRKPKKETAKAQGSVETGIESDGYLAFIAGYTSAGVPYGLTYEEFHAPSMSDDFEVEKMDDEFYVENIEDEFYLENIYDEIYAANTDDECAVQNMIGEFDVETIISSLDAQNKGNEFELQNINDEFELQNTIDQFDIWNMNDEREGQDTGEDAVPCSIISTN